MEQGLIVNMFPELQLISAVVRMGAGVTETSSSQKSVVVSDGRSA